MMLRPAITNWKYEWVAGNTRYAPGQVTGRHQRSRDRSRSGQPCRQRNVFRHSPAGHREHECEYQKPWIMVGNGLICSNGRTELMALESHLYGSAVEADGDLNSRR